LIEYMMVGQFMLVRALFPSRSKLQMIRDIESLIFDIYIKIGFLCSMRFIKLLWQCLLKRTGLQHTIAVDRL